MIQVKALNHYYGHLQALDNAAFQIPTQCVAGFIGPNGAGKSTTLKILTGSLVPKSGNVMIHNVSLYESPLEARRQIGYMPEAPILHQEMQVAAYLQFVSDLKEIPRNKQKAEIERLLLLCGLAPLRYQLIGRLSKGNRQRVALAQALVGDPPVLLLDEPTASLDPSQAMEMRKIIHEMGKVKTILMSSHLLSEVSKICNYLILIKDGSIKYQGHTKTFGVDSRDLKQTIHLKFSSLDKEWLPWIKRLPGVNLLEKDIVGNEIKMQVEKHDVFFRSLYQLVFEKNLPLYEVISNESQLESFFLME